MPAIPPPRDGVGSGIIIHRDGHILINYHVVGGANKVTVKLADRRELDATVVGRDAKSDIALISVGYDGKAVVDAEALPGLVAKTAVGRNVALYLSRHGIIYRPRVSIRELQEADQFIARATRLHRRVTPG